MDSCFLASDTAKDGGFLSAFMGTKGLLTAFLSAFVTVIVYNFCVKRNITIKMPKESTAEYFTSI